MERLLLTSLVVLAAIICTSECKVRGPDEWQGRRIYQVLTDRFARTDGSNQPCPDYNKYCGGTWKGLTNHLDYIANMGFNAIWISPILANLDGGYHGYWTINFFDTNSHFGTQEDLKEFVAAAHAKDVWIMLDMVANHVAPIDTNYSMIHPFNMSSHYHPKCAINNYQCFQQNVLKCRLEFLPDLDQDNEYVNQQLVNSFLWQLNTFDIDGARGDTVMFVNQGFWSNLLSKVGNPFYAGEILNSFDCIKGYQSYGVNGVLNYQLFFTLRSVFIKGQPMTALGGYWREQATLPNKNHVVNFVDNHDMDTFWQLSQNLANYQSALAYLYFTNGVPCVYEGTEQLMKGRAVDNSNRQPVWTTGYNTNTEMYGFLGNLNNVYNRMNATMYEVDERWSDEQVYCLIRGYVLLCVSNTGQTESRTISFLPFPLGTTVCDLFGNSCFPGSHTMKVTIYGGRSPLIWYPKDFVKPPAN